MSDIKYCTFNLRYDNGFDGNLRFEFRAPLIKDVLMRE